MEELVTGPHREAAGDVCGRCVECLHEFPAREMMRFGAHPVCAGCKATAVTKIAQGKPLGRFWRKGRELVVLRTGAKIEFPPRCIACNEPARDYQERSTKLWVVLAAWPPSTVSTTWKFALCERHARRDAFGTLISVSLGLLAVLVIYFTSSRYPALGKALLISLVIAIIAVVRQMCFNVKGRKHRREYSTFSGCSARFLAEFREWPGTL